MKKIYYIPTVMSFDIETTSYTTWETVEKKDGTTQRVCTGKHAWMYCADICTQYGDEFYHRHCRTWQEVVNIFDNLSKPCGSNEYYVIYVHNLSYEFQFMKDWMDLYDIFARKAHNVLRCRYKQIEFRDSLALANCKLEKLPKNEQLSVMKLVGNLDYNKIRHFKTPITKDEWAYQDADTEIVCLYVTKKLKEYGSFSEIPMTSTGEVRYLFRKKLGASLEKVHDLAVKYSAQTKELQNLLLQIYAGAYTHANFQIIEKILKDLGCWDIASSYPFQMVARKYPTNWIHLKPELLNTMDFWEHLYEKYPPSEYAWAFTVCMEKLNAKHCHNTLSEHKALSISKDCIIDNGRIVKANYARFSFNELDWEVVNNFYDMESFVIEDMYISKKEYLPKEIVSVILDLFRQKTELKNKPEDVDNYNRSKARINGIYGMTVFDVLSTGWMWDVETSFFKEEKNFDDFLKTVHNPNNFLWYSIGVWVTSYARKQILTPIKHMSENACYSDTDSVKVKNPKRYKKYMNSLNNRLKDMFIEAMEYHKFTESEYRFFTTRYTDKNGIVHEPKEMFMGIFEEEKPYRRFKTLGAKRYLVEYYDGKMESTVAGAPKNLAEFLWADEEELTLYENNTMRFKKFTNNFVLPDCKLTHTYTEEQTQLLIKDYLGNYELLDVRSGVCLTPTSFSLSLSDEFFNFLCGNITFEDVDIYKYFRPMLY